MGDAVPAELREQVLARIDDDEVVRLASDLVRIPSFTTEETPCAEWLAGYLDDQGLAVTLQEIGIPCCLYSPGRGHTDYHDVHVELADLFLCTRVLALTALEAAL